MNSRVSGEGGREHIVLKMWEIGGHEEVGKVDYGEHFVDTKTLTYGFGVYIFTVRGLGVLVCFGGVGWTLDTILSLDNSRASRVSSLLITSL
jgi:hypothetical protein